jgi:hypothetical protein
MDRPGVNPMSQTQPTVAAPSCPPTSDDLRQQLHQRLDEVIDTCLTKHAQSSFFTFEKALLPMLASLGQLLMQLFLLVRHQQLALDAWLKDDRYRVADAYAERDLQTTWGLLRYGRTYLTPKKKGGGPGVHPLDAQLGLTRDKFTPLVISYFTRLATRVSFRVGSDLGCMFLSWAPAPSAVEQWVLGLGRPAYVFLSTGPLPEGDGEVLVIEGDGKAIPTATDEELAKRRQPRKPRACGCKCKRHTGRCSRKARGPKKKRKRGDKSKNGRSATLVVMYTLKKGPDGQLHGPINKKVMGSFSSRKKVLEWAREQATRRGFGPDTKKTVQLIVDGEICLANRLRKLFPAAILTLDIRHAQERLWLVGRQKHAEGSEELAAWVEPLAELLYQGKVAELLKELRALAFSGPGSKGKRKIVKKALAYLEKRQEMMDYGKWREQDLVLASGVVEGAARHVIGERLDNSGMRWVVQRAEAMLLLRCIEINGDWDAFFKWSEDQRREQLRQGRVVQIRSKAPTQLPELSADSIRRNRRRAKAAKASPPRKEAAA